MVRFPFTLFNPWNEYRTNVIHEYSLESCEPITDIIRAGNYYRLHKPAFGQRIGFSVQNNGWSEKATVSSSNTLNFLDDFTVDKVSSYN